MTVNVASTQLPIIAGLSHWRSESRHLQFNRPPISEPIVCGLTAAFDAVFVFAAGVAAAQISDVPASAYLVCAVAMLGALLSATFWYRGESYKFSHLAAAKASIGMVLKGLAAMIAFQVALTLAIVGIDHADLLWPTEWLALAAVVLCIERAIIKRMLAGWAASGRLSERVAIVGATRLAKQLLVHLEKSRGTLERVRIVGIFDDWSSTPILESKFDALTVGSLDNLIELIRQDRVDSVIVAVPLSKEHRIAEVVERLRHTPVDVRLCPDHVGLRLGKFSVSNMGENVLLKVMDRPLCHWRRVAKDVEDRVLGGLILLMIAPIMLVIAALIKLDSPGPVLFRQKRLGYNNQLIEVLKFRTMYQNMCDANAEKLTERNDPRVTRLGAFLRRTSLDELPQFINVVRGDMSIVGPRPHALSAKAGNVIYQEAVEAYDARHRMKPGITGWAQVNGWRGETQTVEQLVRRVEHDLFYVDNWSIALDLRIIVRTILCGFTGKSAY